MNSWRPYPLLRLFIPFAAGIMAEGFSVFSFGYPVWLPVLMVMLLVTSRILPRVVSSYRLRWLTGLVINLFIAGAGFQIAALARPSNDPDFLGNHPDGLFLAAIAEPPATGNSVVKVILDVKYYKNHVTWVRSHGKALGYLKSQAGRPELHFGDHIFLHAGFAMITDNSNPHAFNYSKYLANKGISHRVFAESWSWRVVTMPPAGYIRMVAYQVRDRLLNILRDNHVEGKEFAVAAALLLGYVNDLDAELRNDYAATGAMHILSVSGMHVGIIYIFLEFLLGFLGKSKPGRVVKAVLLLCFIWFYALVTGLSPCVLRAAAMLSLPIIGKSLSRSPDMYNIMSASVIFILLMDPFLIFDVGFQLSYLAVLGIVVMYKPIYDLYVTSVWLPDKIWSILAVSIAAQIATLPITMYTFHQFPNYFLLTNVFVVPLSSLVIYVGILALVTGNIPVVCMLFSKLLVFLIWLLNFIIHQIEQLPCSTIRGIFISAPEMVVLYVIIVSGFFFLTNRRLLFLYVSLLAAILFSMLLLDFKVHRLKSTRLTIFNSRQEALYQFSVQDKAILLYRSKSPASGNLQLTGRDMVFADMKAHGIKYMRSFWMGTEGRQAELARSFLPIVAISDVIHFAGCRIVVLDRAIPRGFKRNFHADILIISNNPKLSMTEAIRIFSPGQIIFDPTNSRYKTEQWMKDASATGVLCHAVAVTGAFEKDF